MENKKQRITKRRKYIDMYSDGLITKEALDIFLKEDEERLEKKRKYIVGEPIKTFEELLEQEVVFIYGGVRSISFVLSQQFRMIVDRLKGGYIRKAIRKDQMPKISKNEDLPL